MEEATETVAGAVLQGTVAQAVLSSSVRGAVVFVDVSSEGHMLFKAMTASSDCVLSQKCAEALLAVGFGIGEPMVVSAVVAEVFVEGRLSYSMATPDGRLLHLGAFSPLPFAAMGSLMMQGFSTEVTPEL